MLDGLEHSGTCGRVMVINADGPDVIFPVTSEREHQLLQ